MTRDQAVRVLRAYSPAGRAEWDRLQEALAVLQKLRESDDLDSQEEALLSMRESELPPQDVAVELGEEGRARLAKQEEKTAAAEPGQQTVAWVPVQNPDTGKTDFVPMQVNVAQAADGSLQQATPGQAPPAAGTAGPAGEPQLNDPRYQTGGGQAGFIGGMDASYRAPRLAGQLEPDNIHSESMLFRGVTRQVEPTFVDGEEWVLFTGMSPEFIASVQMDMVKAGLMDRGAYRTGTWDPESADAMKGVLSYANFSGYTEWDEALTSLRTTNPRGDKQEQRRLMRQFPLPAKPAPDPATLKSYVRDGMAGLLGRDPTAQELAELSASMASDMQLEYETETLPLAHADRAAQVANTLGRRAPGTPVVPDVDPVARLQELLTERYAPEVAVRRDREQSNVNESNLTNLFGSVQAMTAGGS